MMTNNWQSSEISMGDALFFYTVLSSVFLCPFLYIKGLYNFVTLPQSAFVQVFSILFLIVFLLNQSVFKKSIAVNTHPLNLAVLCFLAWTFISCFHAHNHYEAFDKWCHWAGCILFFFLLQQLLKIEYQAFKILGVLYAAGFVTAVIGILQYLFSMDIIPQSAPPAATFANKNMAAQFITLTFPLGMALLLGAKQKITPWMATISAAVMIVFLIYTRTRGAWVAVFFEIILIFAVLLIRFRISLFWDKNKTMATLAGILLIVLFANIGPSGFMWQFSSIFNRVRSIVTYLPDVPENTTSEGLSKDKEAADYPVRIAIWKNTLEMIKEKPVIGVGLGNHKVYYPLFHAKTVKEKAFSETSQLSNVHNDFLQLFSETGLIGVIAALFMFLLFFLLILQTLDARGNSESVLYAVTGIGVAVAGILVNSCFSFPFEMPVPPLTLMIYFAIALCFSQKTGPFGVNFSGKKGVVLIVLLVPLFFYSVRYYYRDIHCDRYYRQVKGFETAGKWKSVTVLAEKAYGLNPNRKKILSYAARGYIESKAYQKGIDALQEVIKAYPFHMNALLNIGVAYSGLKQYDKAMVFYQKALDIKSDFSKAHINMAGIYMTRKQYDNAVASFEKAAASDPDNPMIFYNMGISQISLKEYEKAAQALEKTVALKSDWPNAQLNLAILYYQHLNRQKQSVPYFQKALEQSPKLQKKNQIEKIIKRFSNKE